MTSKSKKIQLGAVLLATTMLVTPSYAQQASVETNSNATIQVAQNAHVDIIASLEASGYQIIETKTTLFGRIHIYAKNDAHIREVVVSRWTGEVKYDLIVETFAQADANGAAAANGGTTTSETADDGKEEKNSGVSVSVGASASSKTEASAGDDASASSQSSGSVSIGVKLD